MFSGHMNNLVDFFLIRFGILKHALNNFFIGQAEFGPLIQNQLYSRPGGALKQQKTQTSSDDVIRGHAQTA